MINVSHILVLSQPDFVRGQVRSVIGGHIHRWFGRRGSAER